MFLISIDPNDLILSMQLDASKLVIRLFCGSLKSVGYSAQPAADECTVDLWNGRYKSVQNYYFRVLCPAI